MQGICVSLPSYTVVDYGPTLTRSSFVFAWVRFSGLHAIAQSNVPILSASRQFKINRLAKPEPALSALVRRFILPAYSVARYEGTRWRIPLFQFLSPSSMRKFKL